MDEGVTDPTLYQILQVHPAAPRDLITAAYWRLTARAQSLSGGNPGREAALYHLTGAYETLANPAQRAAYDLSLGLSECPVLPKLPRRKHGLASWFTGQRPAPVGQEASFEYYELLRVDPGADPVVVEEAYAVMRRQYLRGVPRDRSREELLDLLELAHAVIADPATRRLYDEDRALKARTAGLTQTTQPASQVELEAPATEPELGAEGRHPQRHRAARSMSGPAKSGQSPKVKKFALPAKTAASRSDGPKAVEELDSRVGAAQIAGAERVGSNLNRFAQSLAARSVGLFSSGGRRAARIASRRLKQVVGEQSASHEFDSAEEEALLERVSTAPISSPSGVRMPCVGVEVLARLRVVDGPAGGLAFELRGSVFTLGSDGVCDARLAGLAPQQARLLYTDGSFALYSLAVNPQIRIHGESVDWAILENGDAIEIGPYKLLFETASVWR